MKTNYKLTLPILALAATSALYSCSDKDSWYENGLPDPDKELIDFTGTNGGITRAGVITRADGAGEMKSFGGDTKIAMRIKSEGKDGDKNRYTVTQMTAKQASSCSDELHTNTAALGNAVHDHLEYFEASSFRYWDDAYGRDAKLSVYAIAVPKKTNIDLASNLKNKDNTKAPKVSETNPNWFTETGSDSQRNEDETFEWSVKTDEQTSITIAEQDICYSNNIRQRSDNDESDKGVYRFYNNNGTWPSLQGMVAGRMQWTPKSTTQGETVGKFDQGHLIFKHALSKVTININEATDTDDKKYGFNNSSSDDFNFTVSGKNVELIGFPVTNTFNLADGSWSTESSKITTTTISKLNETTPTTAKNIQERTVEGLVIPGRKLWNDQTNAMHFVIDDNDYYVTCDQIAKAIRDYYTDGEGKNDSRKDVLKNFDEMKQGEHYVINITLSKTKIESITAQLVDWEEVNSNEIDPKNSYVTVSLESRDGDKVQKIQDGYTFNLYRAVNTSDLDPDINGSDTYYNSKVHFDWTTGYVSGDQSADGDKATLTWDGTNSKWKTNWFWENNKSYYHIRAVGNTEGNETTKSDVTIYKGESTGDYFKITSGKIGETGTNTYKDYTWGAPFAQKNSAKFFYNKTNGFDATSLNANTSDGDTPNQNNHQIYKAIGAADPTTQNINLMMFHMTSQITLNVTTTTDESRVELGSGENDTKVELLHFYKYGTVLVGNGLVKPVTTTVTEKDDFKCNTSKYVAFDGNSNPKKAEESVFEYGVVPQPLKFTHSSTDYTIGIRITTKDGNQYVINDISGIYATVTENHLNIPYTQGTDTNSGKYLINEWYPGYKYEYNVKISKTKILSITAQLVDWETVRGDLGEINLEGTVNP